jgi:pseudouridine-5'-phosphate glycosidase
LAPVHVSNEVSQALADGRPVVALETTIFSNLGLPSPANRQALNRVLAAVTEGGAVPALTAVIDGQVRVGIEPELHDLICGPAIKVAARDIGPALASAIAYGATTVSASVTLAQVAGIDVFATGGIGGVHHGWASTGDISADLPTLARHRVVTVTAGAKVFLDLPATLEYLETAGVPVIGWRCTEFPAFHARSCGLPLIARAENARQVANAAVAHWALGGGGVVLAAPIPPDDEIPYDELMAMVERALTQAGEIGVSGAAVTPAVLGRLAEISEGRSVEANLALATHNAQVAADVAVQLAAIRQQA